MCVCMAYAWRWRMVCYGVCRYGVQACVGTVYGAMALGVRMVYVVYVSCGVRCVYVCMSIYDVVSV